MKPAFAWRIFCSTVLLAGLSLAQSQAPPADPEFQAAFDQGRQALAAGNYEGAISAFKKANKRQKNCAECFLGLAIANMHAGDSGQVLENCDKAISVAPGDSTRAIAHSLKGNVFLALGKEDAGQLAKAEAEYRTAAQLDPQDANFHMGLAMALLKESKDNEAIVELKRCLELQPSDAVAEQANKLIAEPRLGRVTLAPDFHFTSMQGQDISLKQLVGKTVVLDFWATWCPPCRESVPELKELTRKYPSGLLVVISISADEEEKKWRDFIAKKGMDWPQYLDSDHGMRKLFAVNSFPTYLVIDGEGVVRKRIVGLNPQESVIHRLKDELANVSALQAEKKD